MTLSALEARGTAKQVDAYFLHGIDVQPGAVIVDVGADIGLFALGACSRCHDDLVLYAFEPIPEVFELLKVSLAGCRTEGVNPKTAVGTAKAPRTQRTQRTPRQTRTESERTCFTQRVMLVSRKFP